MLRIPRDLFRSAQKVPPPRNFSKVAGVFVVLCLLCSTAQPARASGIGDYTAPFQTLVSAFENIFSELIALVEPHHAVTVELSPTSTSNWHASGTTASAAAFNSVVAASQPQEPATSPTIIHVGIPSNATMPAVAVATSNADHPVSTTSAGAVLGTSTTDGVVTQSEMQAAIEQAGTTLRQLIYANAGSVIGQGQYSTGGYTNNIALSERIDSLSNVTISNATVHGVSGLTASDIPADIVAANYLPLSGGTVSGNFSILGSTTLSNLTLDTNCSTYANGGKLTTDGFGNVLCAADQGGAGSTVGGSDTQIQFNSGGSFAGSSNFTFATSTNVLSVPNVAITDATSTNLFAQNASFSAATSTNLFASLANITNGIFNSLIASVETVTNLNATNATTTNATTTNLYVSGTATLASALSISSGGTGISTAPSYGQMLVGNGSGGYTLTATSSLGIAGGAGAAWGGITGTLANQTDLQTALDAKLSLSSWYATTTDGLAQGTNNKYFSNTLAQAALSVSGLPLTYTAGVIGINQANGSQNGYLSSTDFTTFNNKISSTSLSAAYPLAYNSGTGIFTTAFGTTTSNTFSQLNTFNGGVTATVLTAGTSASLASTTLTGNTLLTDATTTSFAIANVSSSLLKTLSNGAVIAAVAGTDYQAAGNYATFAYPFPSNATTTSIAFNGGLTATNIAASAFSAYGPASFGATATSSFASNGALTLTTALTVPNGGTGATTLTGILKGNGASAFTAASAGTDYVAPATTITAGTGLSGGGDLSTSRTLTLNLGNANIWTALQSFANSSSTLASVFNTLYIGGTATTTIQGNTTGTSTIQGFLNIVGTNSTSTFSGALASTYLNLTGTAATSTAANGFNLTAGCFAVGGTCVGGAPSQWTTSGSNISYTGGSVSIGTTTPGRTLTVFNTSANPQQRISYDATRYAELYADASGALNLTATGKIFNILNGNLYLCDGGACPTTPVQGYPSSFSTNGNLIVGGTVYASGFGPVTCPSGMVPVPASPADGQQGFCVDKYVASSNSGNEVSTSAGSPWVSIAQTNARAACIVAGKHLVTEKEWQAIAHNIEQVASNWSTGVVGVLNGSSQGLPDGLSNYGSSAQTAASAGACSGTVTANTQNCTTGGGTWYDDMREQKLSNGQTIWDVGGNVWQWVDQTVTNDYPIVNSATAGWQACSTSGDGVCGNTLTTNDQWYRGGFATIAGFVRGGNWNDGANVGAFALNLGYAPSSALTNIGFRCSR